MYLKYDGKTEQVEDRSHQRRTDLPGFRNGSGKQDEKETPLKSRIKEYRKTPIKRRSIPAMPPSLLFLKILSRIIDQIQTKKHNYTSNISRQNPHAPKSNPKDFIFTPNGCR